MALDAQAQLGPNLAYPIAAAAPRALGLIVDPRDRSVTVDVTVCADGRTMSTRLVTHTFESATPVGVLVP